MRENQLHYFINRIFFLWLVVAGQASQAQPYYVKIAAGAEYRRSRLHTILWGRNNRSEWTTPVSAQIILLDTMYGGLVPYKKGGGNESRTLRLRSATGGEYVLRSVNKSRQAVTPALLKGSLLADIIQDGVSQSHPYAALGVSAMSTSAGIWHPAATLVYVPQQQALGKYNEQFGNDLYLLEQRPDGDWSHHPYMGSFIEYSGTLKLLKKMRKNNRYSADQQAFIRSRLFDILIADWDRQQDNWRWGISKKDDTFYKPFSRDRDQALYATDGKLTRLMIRLFHLRFMQHFSDHISDVRALTGQDRNLDRIFTNEMSYQDWMEAATALQRALPDSIIMASLQNFPPEIFALSGRSCFDKLRSRRDQLQKYAGDFYKVLARKVQVNGSEGDEYIQVKKVADTVVTVMLYRLRNGNRETDPYYSRIFYASQTRKIKIYGFTGNDQLDIDKGKGKIKISFHAGNNPNQLFRKEE